MQRIFEVGMVAGSKGVLVTLQHRKGVREFQTAQWYVGALLCGNELFLVDRARRRHLPSGYHGILLCERGAKKRDRADVLERLRLDDRRNEARSRVRQHHELTVGERHGPKKTRLRVRNRF